MFEYLQDKFEWTDNQVYSINWKAVQVAKKQKKRRVITLTSKMVHRWLNIGWQKVKVTTFAEGETCLPYGKEEEDQV